MTNIAALLNIPVNQLKTVTFSLGAMSHTPLRLALDTTCRIHERVVDIVGLREERIDDIEINALLLLLEQNQKDSCQWVSFKSLAPDASVITQRRMRTLRFTRIYKFVLLQLARTAVTDLSVCSAEILHKICFHWEALIISEEAEQGLQDYITTARIAIDEWLSKQITTLSVSEIILNYFSSKT